MDDEKSDSAFDEFRLAVSEPKSEPSVSPDEYERALDGLRDAVDSWRSIGGTTQWAAPEQVAAEREMFADLKADAERHAAPVIAAINRLLAEEPKPGDIRLVEVPPRHAMTQNVPIAWVYDEVTGVVAVDPPGDTTAGFVAGGSFEVPVGVPGFARLGNCPLCVVCDAELPDAEGRWLHAVAFPGVALQVVTCNTDACKAQAEAATRRRADLQLDGEGNLVPSVPIAKAPPPEALPAVRAKLDEIRQNPTAPLRIDPAPHAFVVGKFRRGERGGMWPEETCDVCGYDPHNMIHVSSAEAASPPPRPDGFSQSAVDAAKAVLLSTTTKRGGR